MKNAIEFLLTIYDALSSNTAKDFYAGAAFFAMAALTAELILGMF